MISIRFSVLFAFCLFLSISFYGTVESTYRKPPFNGSIFGKRSNTEYESNSKTLAALCDFAIDACQSLSPFSQEK
ncbi:SIFamide-related peptide [Condylostylus longicornis]|uniref:SIFamide-related peptide n=1 Tax=Condylostylus longicornis TaxID=2530218 RepID=UPI00244DA831|nr:SIFamide-related peptide [Condylostylus longicornis]